VLFRFVYYLREKTMSNNETVTTLERLANLLRIHSVESTQAANSGLDRLILFIYYLFIYSYYIDIQLVVHRWLK